jgi:hypothetical protein
MSNDPVTSPEIGAGGKAAVAVDRICTIGGAGTKLGSFFDLRNERALVQFSPDSASLLVAFRSSIAVFDARSGTQQVQGDLRTLFSGSEFGSSTPYAIFADIVAGTTLLGVAYDGHCVVLDPFKGADQEVLKLTAGSILGKGFVFETGGIARNGKGIIAGAHFRYIQFDLNKKDEEPKGINGPFAKKLVTVSPDGGCFAAVPQQGDTVDIQRLDDGQRIHRIKHSKWFARLEAGVSDIKFTPGTPCVLIAHRKGMMMEQHLSMWDIRSGALSWTCKAGGEPTTVVRLAVTPDGSMLLSAEGPLIRVRDTGTGNALAAIDAPEGGCVAIVWAPDCQTFATVGKNGGGAVFRLRA